MKIIQQISIFFLLTCTSIQVMASPDCWGRECKELHVMAPSGLTLRDAPSLHGKILLAIPFGKTVRNHGIASREVMIGGIKSTWMKVTYKGKTGYSFGAYLSNVKQVPSTDINKEVRLEFGGGCEGDINYDPRLNWYGIYWDHENKESKILSIKPQLLTSENTDEGHFELMDYSLRDSSIHGYTQFMFGSKKKLSPQSSLINFGPNKWINLSRVDTSFHVANMLLTSEIDPNLSAEFRNNPWGIYYSEISKYELKISLGPRKQVLSFDFARSSSQGNSGDPSLFILEPIVIQFAGDLDGDGITDLMIRVGGEKSGENILYLSSYAEGGDILKMVATRSDGYCC